MTINKLSQELLDNVVAFRRDFHKHPEMGFKEERSSGIIAGELTKLGYKVQIGVAKTGVVALLGSGSPVTLLRFDMDALPVTEQTGVNFSSENPGVMHACGHDGHMAIGLTVARLLAENKTEWKGTVKFVFQPAEEGLGGAEQMIKAGILENPKPDFALGVHIWNEKPLGWVGVKSGPIMAGADIFTIKITGAGGHGALPHQSKDPVIAAANVILSAQSIISRNISPLQSGVISFTQVQSGETFNVIPPTAIIKGTIRFFNYDVHETMKSRLTEICKGISAAMGCQADVDIQKLTPALVNDPKITIIMTDTIKDSLPDLKIDDAYITMGSEDMAYIQEKIPGCYIFVGSANEPRGLVYGHHSPKFNFDEDALSNTVLILANAVIKLNS